MPGLGCLNGFEPTADVTYTVFSHTMGDDHPRPGISCDHATPSLFDHFSGSFLEAAMPLIPCPRKPGHVFAGFGSAATAIGSRAA
jgi:hypothetical protein